MEHGARLSTSRVMAIAFIFMSVLIVLSLSVNVIQGGDRRERVNI
ncbi:conjugative transfer protein [Escherichia coli]|nr:conjugative transfer protein [Escherichia coli]